MYVPGYYPVIDLNDNTANGGGPSHHETKIFGQCHDGFATRTSINGCMGYEKEQLRQTILKQETMFRHQVQKHMMNEVRSKEPQSYLNRMDVSQPTLFANFPVNERIRWHDSSSPSGDFNCRMTSLAGAGSLQYHSSSLNARPTQTDCVTSYKRSRFCDDDTLDPKHKKVQRRLFDLEAPADEYKSDEEEGRGTYGGSGVNRHLPVGDSECNYGRSSNWSQNGVHSSFNGDALSSSRQTGAKGFINLNEPSQIEEGSGTTSIDALSYVYHSKDEKQSWAVTENSCTGFHCKTQENSQNPHKQNYVGVSRLDPHIEKARRQKEQVAVTSSYGLYGSSQAGYKKSQEHDGIHEAQRKKSKIFGVEISETGHGSPITSSTSFLRPLVPRHNTAYSESSSSLSRDKHSPSSAKNIATVNGNSGSITFPCSVQSSALLIHDHEDKSKLVPYRMIEQSYQNGHFSAPNLDSKGSHLYSADVGSASPNGISEANSASNKVHQHIVADNHKVFGWLVNPKSAENTGGISDPTLNSENPSIKGGGLSWLKATSLHNCGSSKELEDTKWRTYSPLQKYSEQCDTAEPKSCPSQSFLKDSLSGTIAHDKKDRRTQGGDCSSTAKTLQVPTAELSKDLPSTSSASKPSSSPLELDRSNCTKVGLFCTDLNRDPSPSESEERELVTVVGERDSVCSDKVRCHIDLNVSMMDDEAHFRCFNVATKKKNVVEIDLEVPLVDEVETAISSESGPLERKSEEQVSLTVESRIEVEGPDRLAAEALIAISDAPTSETEASHQSETFLQWFAEIVSFYNDEMENIERKMQKDVIDLEDSVSDELDYFEHMTLNLVETNEETCNIFPQVEEITEEDTTIARRPRRGPARRGRPKKDFQRDVLPGLLSLSRNDVTEDLQMIEGLVRATGGTWQLNYLSKISSKGRRGRGRKRSTGCSEISTTVTTVNPTPTEQPKCADTGTEETGLTGWGKRTRRPPRQRCPINGSLI